MRFPDSHDMAKGDKRGMGGWCIYNEYDNLGVLSFGSWHEGDKQTWSSVSQDYMDDKQRKAFMDSIDAARRIRDEEDRRAKEHAQGEFLKIWQNMPEAMESHPYLVRKKVKPHGIKLWGDKLLIPMANGGKLVGLQTIAPDGTKKFERHSTKGYFILGDIQGDKLLICEGYSTGASIYGNGLSCGRGL